MRRGEARVLIPWQWIRVSGPSMVPTLKHGDVVIVRHGARVRAGDLVIARFRSMPGRLVVKRAVWPVDGGWWLSSDNLSVRGDSEVYGVADVHARVVLRLRGWRASTRVHGVREA
jgi:phage repressor protein C with HTH and peptisase S24 domain